VLHLAPILDKSVALCTYANLYQRIRTEANIIFIASITFYHMVRSILDEIQRDSKFFFHGPNHTNVFLLSYPV
jgi:hypothetical protein